MIQKRSGKYYENFSYLGKIKSGFPDQNFWVVTQFFGSVTKFFSDQNFTRLNISNFFLPRYGTSQRHLENGYCSGLENTGRMTPSFCLIRHECVVGGLQGNFNGYMTISCMAMFKVIELPQ